MKLAIYLLIFFIPIPSFAQTVEEDNAGIYAPDFTFDNIDGAQLNLESLRGRVVYISFWASWCKPCIQGFEKYAETRKAIADLGVVLLNISIDSNADNWKTAIEKYNIEGMHGITPKSELLESYQLYNVPRYEIVGKTGAFLYLDRSDGLSVLENFELFLKEND